MKLQLLYWRVVQNVLHWNLLNLIQKNNIFFPENPTVDSTSKNKWLVKKVLTFWCLNESYIGILEYFDFDFDSLKDFYQNNHKIKLFHNLLWKTLYNFLKAFVTLIISLYPQFSTILSIQVSCWIKIQHKKGVSPFKLKKNFCYFKELKNNKKKLCKL